MRVRIISAGREVDIECPDVNVSYSDVAAVALATWKATDAGPAGMEGPAFGFSSQLGSGPPRWADFDTKPLTVTSEVPE